MKTLGQDLRYALRQLRRNPGFAAVAVLTLAIGVGANTAIFSVLRSALLRPLPYGEPDRVVMVWNTWVDYEETWLSEPELMDYRRGVDALEELAAWADAAVNLTGEGEPERVPAAVVTPNTLAALGVRPALGRGFTSAEGEPGTADQVVLLGHDLWLRRFGGEPAAVGRSVEVDGQRRRVVGVLPAGFRLPTGFASAAPAELYVPLALDPDSMNSRGSHYLLSVGRLRPGATAEDATAQLRAVTGALTEEGVYPPQIRFSAFAVPVEDAVLGSVRTALWVLFGAVLLVLLIACVNVAGLLLARSEARRREFAVRAAMGAGRGAILRQLLVEGGLLAAAGAAAGLAVGGLSLRALQGLNPGNLPRVGAAELDLPVLAFALLLACGCAVAFGLIPAFHLSREDLRGAAAEGTRTSTVGSSRLRFQRGLVGLQAALALLLLVGAGLTVRTFWHLLEVDPGFRPAGVLTARVSLPQAEYPDTEQVVSLYDGLLESARGLPGVRSAAGVRFLPLSGTIGDWTVEIRGREPAPGQDFDGDWQVVTPGYFETMGIRLMEGRAFTQADRASGTPVLIVSERMARDYWPGGSAVGKQVRFGGEDAPWRTIVGVVGNVRHSELTGEWRRAWYAPHAQWALSIGSPLRAMGLVLRTEGDPMAVAGPLRDAVRSLDPDLPLSQVMPLRDLLGEARAEPRFAMTVLFAFAVVALALASVGVYGTMSYAVRQRSRELGIRLALGARAGDVLRMVLRQGLAPVALGLLAGLAAALLVGGLLRSLLFGVEPADPATLAAACLVFGAVAALACWLPARRATRVDPAEVLRTE